MPGGCPSSGPGASPEVARASPRRQEGRDLRTARHPGGRGAEGGHDPLTRRWADWGRMTSMADLHTETIHLDTPDGPMATLRTMPTGEPRGGVVVVQEAFGLTGHIERVTQALAADGWIAVAPALFHRSEQQIFD